MDITQWGMGKDGTGPVKVIASTEGRHWAWDRGFRRQNGARLVYADGLELLHVGGTRWGTVFFGDRGVICVDRGRFAIWEGDGRFGTDRKVREGLSRGTFDGLKKIAYYNGRYDERVDGVKREIDTATNEFGMSSMHAIKLAEERLGFKVKDFKKQLYASRNQVQNFVECVTARTDTISNHHVGPWTSVLCQLVHMSYVHDTGFDWNPAKMTFANGTGKADWLSRVEIRPNAHRFEVKA